MRLVPRFELGRHNGAALIIVFSIDAEYPYSLNSTICRAAHPQAAASRWVTMGSSPEQVVAAVQALYSSQPDQQAHANAWLTSFQRSHEAWQVALHLLAPQQPQEVQFFAATLLVRKVRADWSKLEASTRQGLGQAIRCARRRWRAAAAKDAVSAA